VTNLSADQNPNELCGLQAKTLEAMVPGLDYVPIRGPFLDSVELTSQIEQAASGQAGPVEIGPNELKAVAQIAYIPEKVGETFRYNHHQRLRLLLDNRVTYV
jgi:hypothetical protein